MYCVLATEMEMVDFAGRFFTLVCLFVSSGVQLCMCATREPWPKPTPWSTKPVSVSRAAALRLDGVVLSGLQQPKQKLKKGSSVFFSLGHPGSVPYLKR